jgi:hypothetical protein
MDLCLGLGLDYDLSFDFDVSFDFTVFKIDFDFGIFDFGLVS